MNVDTMRRIDRFHGVRPFRGETLTPRVAIDRLVYFAKDFAALVNMLLYHELSVPCSKAAAWIDR